LTIDAAIEHVKSARPIAEPHPELIESIRSYFNQKPQSNQI
jgi:hypothetical protein